MEKCGAKMVGKRYFIIATVCIYAFLVFKFLLQCMHADHSHMVVRSYFQYSFSTYLLADSWL